MSTAIQKKVLILGGGFGGVYSAMRLEKLLGRDASIQITLVSSENFFLFTPLLHEVAACDLEATDIVSPIRALLKRVDFFEGDVTAIDLPGRSVKVAHGKHRHEHTFSYDYLIIAIGSTDKYLNLPGVQENSIAMKTLGDGIHLRNRMIATLEEAGAACGGDDREALMTFVVAGGGFAGIETMGAVNDFIRGALRFNPRIQRDQLRFMVIETAELVLPELGPELGRYAEKKLSARGVEIRTKTSVTAASDGSVTLSDGSIIKTHMLIWTAGVAPPPLVNELPCEKKKGRMVVNEFLEVEGFANVWAVGDSAAVPDGKGGIQPQTAQHALREAIVAADNIAAAIRGGKKKPFVFSTLGQLAAIGHHIGVARIFGFKFSGFFAWWMWRTVYLMKLPRFEKKLCVAIGWTLDLFFPKDLVQFQTHVSGATAQSNPPGADPRKPTVA